MLLVKLDGKRVYESNEFEMEQHQHRQGIQKKLQSLHKEIINTMKKTFEVRFTVKPALVTTCGEERLSTTLVVTKAAGARPP